MPINPSISPAEMWTLAELGEFLLARRADITRLWIAAVDRSPEITSSNDLTYKQLLDHLPQLCEELAEILKTAASGVVPATVPSDAAVHGRKRWQQGYRLDEVIREICLIRRNVFDRWLAEFSKANSIFAGEIKRTAKRIIHQFFDDVIVESTVQFVQENAELEKRIKDSFLAMMSHNLRTPLPPILFGATALKDEPGLSEQGREMIEIIIRNAKLEAGFIDQLLGVSAVNHET